MSNLLKIKQQKLVTNDIIALIQPSLLNPTGLKLAQWSKFFMFQKPRYLYILNWMIIVYLFTQFLSKAEKHKTTENNGQHMDSGLRTAIHKVIN